MEDGEGKEGWVKISEEKYPDGLMNRKSAADMLERLTEFANVSLDDSSLNPRRDRLCIPQNIVLALLVAERLCLWRRDRKVVKPCVVGEDGDMAGVDALARE